MRILVVASFNKGFYAPFIVEQVEALKKQGCAIEFFGLQGKGLRGYLRNLPFLKKKIKEFRPDVIHAHYGLSGLFANLQRRVPVVTTYHGSDINDKNVLLFSKIAIRLSSWNVFVSRKTLEIARPRGKYILLPCGIDMFDLQQTEKTEARRKMNLLTERKYVLFAGAFDIAVKNAPLAKESVACLQDGQTELLELKGYTREEVTLLMCAADAFLLTSHTEGSPQVVKEALACGCPIVSVDVGDVRERVGGVDGCFVSDSRNPEDLANLLWKAFEFVGKTEGRKKIVEDGLDNLLVANQLIKIYERVLKSENH